MKKALLAGFASMAAAVALQADVVSVNAVGYANVVVPPGFSMIANQLNSGNNTIGSILPDPTPGTRIFKWTGTSFAIFDYVQLPPNLGGGKFWDPNGNATLNPGEGAFIFNPTANNMTLTLVGEVPTGAASNVSVPAGFAIMSSTVPQAGALNSALGFPVAPGDRVFLFNGTSYSIHDFVQLPPNLGGGTLWDPSEPTAQVGQAFFSFKGGATTWNRNFSL